MDLKRIVFILFAAMHRCLFFIVYCERPLPPNITVSLFFQEWTWNTDFQVELFVSEAENCKAISYNGFLNQNLSIIENPSLSTPYKTAQQEMKHLRFSVVVL